jgi:hypothetical protein
MSSPNVKYDWWLCKTKGLEQITQLSSAHDKQLQLALDQGGTGTFWLHIEDKKTAYIEEHKTSVLVYRNKNPIWSGEIFDCLENVDNNNNFTLQVTVLGWFELLNKRMIHTGYEWKEMAVKASGRTIIKYLPSEHEKELEQIQKQYEAVLAEGFYKEVATESAQQLFYHETPLAEVINDLIIRANIDVPTGITIGEIAPTNSINQTFQQFQNVGEAIMKLVNLESGCDFHIDPVTRKFNTYRNEIRGGIAGLGVDRGSKVRFTYPGNCVLANRSSKGTKTQNRTEAIGQYSVGKEESIQSIEENGLFEAQDSLPEVVNQNILNAYAAIETLTLEQPFKVLTFNPRAVNNSQSYAVPRPFEDYEIGDIVYAVVNKGPRFKVGFPTPQAVRIFGFNINDEDSGTEKITGIQTTYQS